jgi:hypothetical protein
MNDFDNPMYGFITICLKFGCLILLFGFPQIFFTMDTHNLPKSFFDQIDFMFLLGLVGIFCQICLINIARGGFRGPGVQLIDYLTGDVTNYVFGFLLIFQLVGVSYTYLRYDTLMMNFITYVRGSSIVVFVAVILIFFKK